MKFTFRELGEREDVADRECSFLATVDECTSVKTLGCNEGLTAELVPVGIAEDDAGERSTTMDNSLSDSLYWPHKHVVELIIGQMKI
jgi:hypothetical protein